MKLRNKPFIFRYPRLTWRITWFLGGALLIVSWLLNHDLYHIYLYFIFVGSISLINSLRKYAKISDAGLTFYHGNFFYRKILNIDWGEILDVKYTTIEEFYTISGGARVWFSKKQREEIEILTVFLKTPLNQKVKKQFRKYINQHFFKPSISVNESGDKILLIEAPESGFRKFILEVARHLQISEKIEKPMNPYLYYFCEFFIISHVTLGLVMYFASRIMLFTTN